MDSRAVSIKIIWDRCNVTYQTTPIQKKIVKPIPTQKSLKINNKLAFYLSNIYQEKTYLSLFSGLKIHQILYQSNISRTITLDFIKWEHTCTGFAFPVSQEPLPADITLADVESVQFECSVLWNSGDVQTDCATSTACSTTDDTVQRTCHLFTQS